MIDCPQEENGICLVASKILGKPCEIHEQNCLHCAAKATFETPTAPCVALAIVRALRDGDQAAAMDVQTRYASVLIPEMPAALTAGPTQAEGVFDCIHRSVPKAKHECKTCWSGKGRVVDVFDCAKFGKRCTVFSDFETGLQCARCSDRVAPEVDRERARLSRCAYLDTPAAWAGRYQGATCFLVCGGPSLRQIDWSVFPKRGPVIFAINNAGASIPRTPDLWVGMDESGRFSPSIWRDASVAKFVSGARIKEPIRDHVGGEWQTTQTAAEMANIHKIVRHGGPVDVGSFFTDSNLQNGKGTEYEGETFRVTHRSTMFWAMRIMIDLGFTTINLVGCDFEMDEADPYGWTEHRPKGVSRGNNATMRFLAESLTSLAPVIEQMGVDVWNCTPGGKLHAFKRRSFEDACRASSFYEPETLDGLYNWWLPKIAAITCTADRPATFGRCEQFVASQSRPADLWIVADSGKAPARPTSKGVKYLRIAQQATPWESFVANMTAAIETADHEKMSHVAFIEDDDFYGQDWLRAAENVVGTGVELFGERVARQYNVPSRKWREVTNRDHASTGQTVMSIKAAREFLEELKRDPHLVDIRFWHAFQRSKRLIDGCRHHVAIKGLNQTALGGGHDAEKLKGWKDDQDGSTLASWIGPEAAAFYIHR